MSIVLASTPMQSVYLVYRDCALFECSVMGEGLMRILCICVAVIEMR